MTDKYCQTLYAKFREQIEEISKPLLSNGINSFEHYRYISGKKEGMERALHLAKELYKNMYEVDNLSFENGEEHERSSRERTEQSRNFY